MNEKLIYIIGTYVLQIAALQAQLDQVTAERDELKAAAPPAEKAEGKK